MTDLVDDDKLYSGRCNENDTHLSDDNHNIIIYNWCSLFFFTDVVYKWYRVQKWKRDEVDPFDMVYNNLSKKHFVLRKVKPCGYCNVKRFPWRVLPLIADKEKCCCILQMFLMSYNDCF
jgi:hypothetical protein